MVVRIRRKKRTMRPERKIQTRSRCSLFVAGCSARWRSRPGPCARCGSGARVARSGGGFHQRRRNARGGGIGETRRKPGRGRPRAWTSPALALGAASVAEENIPVLGVFALAYAHLLEVLDDDEFFIAQTPFSLSEQRAVAAAANTLVARERLRRVPSCDPLASSASRDLALDRYWVTAACASLLRALVTRDERRVVRASTGCGWRRRAKKRSVARTFFERNRAAAFAGRRRVRASRDVFELELSSESITSASEESPSADRGFAAFLRDCPHAAFETRTEAEAQVLRGRARVSASARRRAAWTPTARHRANAFGQSRVYAFAGTVCWKTRFPDSLRSDQTRKAAWR